MCAFSLVTLSFSSQTVLNVCTNPYFFHMNRGKGQDQLKCLGGVTRRVTQSHKLLFCTAQGFGPGYVFVFKMVTPGNLPSEGQGNLRETAMYLTSLHGAAKGSSAPSEGRTFRSSPRKPAQQITFLELSAPRGHF